MRMWNVNPKLLCKKHLLGEHLETHMFESVIKFGRKYNGYLQNGLLETHNLKKRHDEIAQEMKIRGYNHKTPMEKNNFNKQGFINENENIKILFCKCLECRKRISEIMER